MNITDRNTSGFRNDHAFPTVDFPIIPPFSSVFLRKRTVFDISGRRNKVFSGAALYVQTVHIFIKNAFVLCQAFSDRFCYNGKRVLYTQRAKRERWEGRKKKNGKKEKESRKEGKRKNRERNEKEGKGGKSKTGKMKRAKKRRTEKAGRARKDGETKKGKKSERKKP